MSDTEYKLTGGVVIAHAQRLIGRMVGRGLVPKAMPADDYTALWGAMTEEFSAIEAATAAKYAERIAELERKADQDVEQDAATILWQSEQISMHLNRIAELQAKLDEGTPWQAEQIAGLLDITKELQAKLDAAAVDAERYRIARTWESRQKNKIYISDGSNPIYEERLDEALDAAIDAMCTGGQRYD